MNNKPERISLDSPQELIISNFILRKNGIEAIGEPTFEEWLSCGEFIRNAGQSVHFWIGDFLNYGEERWGDRYRQVSELTGFDKQTLRNDKWISSRVDPTRRRESLSFDHYQQVAELEPDEQEELLQVAEDKKLTTKQFRVYVKTRDLFGRQEQMKAPNQQPSLDQTALVTTLQDNIIVLLANIDSVDFASLSPASRSQLLKSLQKVEQRINGLLMEYDDDE